MREMNSQTSDFEKDPIERFKHWFSEVKASGQEQHDAFALGTVNAEGKPSVRFLLLKGVDERGFKFFTNYLSQKAKNLEAKPFASMTFFWPEIYRQVRIEGSVEKTTPEESDMYWKTRARDSQIGGWASPQSEVIQNREVLEKRVNEIAQKFEGKEIPRPPHWGGFILHPVKIEFWTGRTARLHEREVYLLDQKGAWTHQWLAP